MKVRHSVKQKVRTRKITRKVIGKGHRLYKIWDDMIQRCTNPNDKDYPNYGGRGITICRSWKRDFLHFARWSLQNGYTGDRTIDRINTNGGYNPKNVQWATHKQQANNRRTNIMIEYQGRPQTLMQWCEELNLPYATIYARLKRKRKGRTWTVEEAFTSPIRSQKADQSLPIV